MNNFRKGQIWYWNDPICGAHIKGYIPPEGDGVIRYSRYVIIIQNSDNIDDNSILVIPCSSEARSKFDVKLKISPNYSDFSYARVSCVFPVKHTQLQRLVYTVDDDIMERLENSMLKLIYGSELNTMKEKINHYYYDENGVRHVISKYLQKVTLTSLDVIDNVPRSRWNSKNIRKFVYDYMNLGVINTANKYDIKVTYASRLYARWTAYVNKYRIDQHIRGRKWNSDSINKFMDYVIKHNLYEAAIQYGMNVDTVRRYYKKWIKLIDIDELDTTQTVSTVIDDTDKIRNIKPSTIESIISKISTELSRSLEANNIYENLKVMSNRNCTVTDSRKMFYSNIERAISESLIDYLNIRGKKGYKIPSFTKDMYNYNTWKFLNVVANDETIKNKNGIELFEYIIKSYHNKIKIDSEWTNILRRYISRKVNIVYNDLETIINYILDLCCVKSL